MANKVKKGNYYRLRTKKYLQGHGFVVENLEKTQRIYQEDKTTGEKKVIFVKRDLWGADLIAKDDEDLIFIQVKTNRGDISTGIKELMATPWPGSKNILLWVVYWERGSREPEIHDAREGL